MANIDQTTNELTYPSPINENLTNVTLLSLYRYNTSFAVVMKDAYDSNSLKVLADYMNGTFGAPAYNDANTVAYNVTALAAKSAYRSFVSYYQYGNLSEVAWPYEGKIRNYWLFNNETAITVYAPYNNGSSASAGGEVDTEMSFNAIAIGANSDNTLSNTILRVTAIWGSEQSITSLQLKQQPMSYSVWMNLTPGPLGNKVMLEVDNGIAGIANVTFSSAVLR